MMSARVTGAALVLVFATAVIGAKAECPVLNLATVDADCSYFSKSVPCNQTQLPGTIATFRCKPLYEVLYNYRPAGGNISICREDGSWSIKPFKCYPICGQPTGKGIPRVQGGKAVESAAMFPWHVILYDRVVDKKSPALQRAICGGSLIKPKFFISAAHCFYANKRIGSTVRNPSDFFVATGKMFRSLQAKDTEQQVVNISKIYLKDYGNAKQNYANDIALVELESEVEITATTMPICVDWEENQRPLRTNDSCLVVGWGGKGDKPYSELQYTEMPFVDREECKHKVPSETQVYSTMDDKFCVAAVNGTNVAHGDSGGGVAVRSRSHQWFLRGVVSVGADNSQYAFVTNVTVFTRWIASIIQGGEVKGLRCGVSDNAPRPGMLVDEGQGFPWDVDVYGVNGTDDSYTLLTGGVLVLPSLVATVSWDKNTDALIGQMRPTSLKVALGRKGTFTGLQDAVHVSRVRQVLYPDSLIRDSFLYTIALLELQSPINVMPACVDWNHDSVLQKEAVGVSIAETPENTRKWIELPLMNSTTCKRTTNFSYVNSYNLCANISGTGKNQEFQFVMQQVDHVWFLRAVLGIESSESAVVLTDLADAYVMDWLVKSRSLIGKSESCGQFAMRSVPVTDAPVQLHMPWNVAVLVTDSKGQTSSAGVLIRNNVVITSNAHLVLRHAQSGSDPAVEPDNVTVAIREQDGTTRMVAVETWSTVGTGSETLYSAPYVERSVCHALLQQTTVIFPADVHCVGPFPKKLWSGSGFFTRAAEGWYLRGISAFHWESQVQKELYSFTSLAHPAMVQWLGETLKDIPFEHVQHTEEEDSSAWLEDVVVPKGVLANEEGLMNKTYSVDAVVAVGDNAVVVVVVSAVVGLSVLVIVGGLLAWCTIRRVTKRLSIRRRRAQFAHDNSAYSMVDRRRLS